MADMDNAFDNEGIVSALKNTATHSQEQPNPAQPYLDMFNQYSHGGIPEVLKNKGYKIPPSVDWLAGILSNPDNQAALGMAAPWAGKVKDLATQGKTYAQIAKEVGATRGAVAGEMYRQGLTSPKEISGLRDLKIWGDAKNLRKQGYSFRDISSMLDEPLTNVERAFTRPAGHTRAPGMPTLDFMKGPSEEIDPRELSQYLKIFGFK